MLTSIFHAVLQVMKDDCVVASKSLLLGSTSDPMASRATGPNGGSGADRYEHDGISAVWWNGIFGQSMCSGIFYADPGRR